MTELDQQDEETMTPGGRGRRGHLVAIPLGIMVAVLIVDQLSKWLITRTLGPAASSHRFEIIAPIFRFHYVENSGAAFGIFRGQTVLLTVMALLVVASMVALYRKVTRPALWTTVSLGLLLGGALGNLVDRIRLGYVVDFISVGVWPTFNLADSAITIGVLIIAFMIVFGDGVLSADRPREHEPAASPLPSPPDSPGIPGMSHHAPEQ